MAQVWDLAVVGAGVAGCALAYSQGRAGRRVLILERDLSQPDRIVGELLQPGGYLALTRLGLAQCCEGIDSQKASSWIAAISVHGHSRCGHACLNDAVVGLQMPAAERHLLKLGLHEISAGAMQVFGYCMFKDEREAKVFYPTEGFSSEVSGRSFHNGEQKLQYSVCKWKKWQEDQQA